MILGKEGRTGDLSSCFLTHRHPTLGSEGAVCVDDTVTQLATVPCAIERVLHGRERFHASFLDRR